MARIPALPPGLWPLRGSMAACFLLVDAAGVTLIDTGWLGDAARILALLEKTGRRPPDLHTILLTHGHVDHAWNVAALQRACGARCLAHPLERTHVAQRHAYRGLARIVGAMEWLNVRACGYRAGSVDFELADDQELPLWGGLRVVHLPGHTEGHCGFYSERHDVLFCGDLFASSFRYTHLPPPYLNARPELFPRTFAKAVALEPGRVFGGHLSLWDGEDNRRRLYDLFQAKFA